MLDYVSLSRNMTNMITDMVEIRQTELNPGQYSYPKNPGFNWWMDRYITYYDQDANNGEFDHTSVKMVNKPELLRFYLTGYNCDTMARSIANFWKAQLTPNIPEYNGIISITNDAEKLYPLISGYMCSYASRANVLDLPGYQHLFKFIEEAVETVKWTVTESIPDGTITYTVKIT